MVDEVGVGCEHPVREPVIAHELPDVLGGVELRAFGREHHERDVVWNHEAGREVPSGLVDDEYGVLAGSHFGGDFGEVQVHRLGVAGGQDERGSLAIAGADSPEDVGGSGALIVRRRGPRSPSCPAPGDLVLLPVASGPRKPPTADRHTSSGSKKFGPALVRGSFGTATAPFPQSRHRHPRVSTSHTTSPVMAVSLSRAATIRSCSSLPNNCD